jgi:hypothetical protein
LLSKPKTSWKVPIQPISHFEGTPGMEDALKYRFKLAEEKTQMKKEDCISDIVDGQMYKVYTSHLGLDKWYNISLCLFTDGATFNASSDCSLWPIMFSIVELHPSLRHKFEHIIFGGFWLFHKSPNFCIYLKTVFAELYSLGTDGIPDVCFTSAQGHKQKHTMKVFLLMAMADSPAKAKLLGIRYWNDHEGGCNSCNQKPIRCENKSVYVWDITSKEFACDEDKPASFKREKRSPFELLPYFDTVNQTPVDSMHSCWLGTAKKFLHLWTEVKNKPWSLSDYKIKKMNERLDKITVPLDFSRYARKYSKKWKGTPSYMPH